MSVKICTPRGAINRGRDLEEGNSIGQNLSLIDEQNEEAWSREQVSNSCTDGIRCTSVNRRKCAGHT